MKQKCIRKLSITEISDNAEGIFHSQGDEGTKQTVLQLEGNVAVSSFGFTMPIKNNIISDLKLMTGHQEEDNHSQFNNKKKERNKQHSLKHLSMMVKNFVGQHKATTYKEMSDKLVSEISARNKSQDNQNLKRRIYDSINVMVALGVFEKQKKIITKGWIFQQNRMTSKYARETLERLKMQNTQQAKIIQEKKKLFQKLTDQIRRCQAQQDQNIDLIKEGTDCLNTQQRKLFYFPLMIFKLPLSAKVDIETDENKKIVNIRCNTPIKLIADMDILPLIKRIEEAKDSSVNLKF